jgi:hypothetical protein
MRSLRFGIVFLSIFFSCKQEIKKDSTTSSEASELKTLEIHNPVTGNSSLPRLFVQKEKLFLSWVEKIDTVSTFRYSIFVNDQWTPAVTVISGSDWFVNWADFPAIAESNGNILSSFLQKSDSGTYTYDVKLNLYNGKTKTWKKNFILHDDGTKSEHGFVSVMPYVGDSFVVSWLDGRQTAGADHGGGEMTLRAAIVFEDGSIDYDTLLDERVCDCCQTSTAIGPNDVILVAYRDRTDDEIRDISVVRWQMETGWSNPMTIGNDNWKIPGCPVNGPSIATYGDGVAVAWFTAADEKAKVQVAFSHDTGVSFGAPYRIDSGNATGRVDLVMLSKTQAAVLWMEPNGEDELLQLVKIDSEGTKSKVITVSKTSAERASGFPQLERVGDDLFIAWTNVSETVKSVKTSKIPISEL